MSPDTSTFYVSTSLSFPMVTCNNIVTLNPMNGTYPYFYHWNNMIDPGTQNYIDHLCTGDSLFIQVQDSNGCTTSFNYTIPFTNVGDGVSIFPNPTSDVATTQFTLEEDAFIKAELYDNEGKLIEILFVHLFISVIILCNVSISAFVLLEIQLILDYLEML